MKVNMNKTKVSVRAERQKLMQDGHVVSVVEAMVVIQYHVLVVKSEYTRSVMV